MAARLIGCNGNNGGASDRGAKKNRAPTWGCQEEQGTHMGVPLLVFGGVIKGFDQGIGDILRVYGAAEI